MFFIICGHGRMAGVKNRRIDADERRRLAATLGDLAEAGIGIFCWCNRCGHNAVLAVAPLIAELGPAFPVPEIGARTRCSGCGSKDVATRPDWPTMGQVARH
jgi:hypothetical protein